KDWNRGLALDHTLRGGQLTKQFKLAYRDLHRSRGYGGFHRHKVRLPETCHFSCYFWYYLISNTKPIKPAVTVGDAEKWKTLSTHLFSLASLLTAHVRNRSRTLRSAYCNSPRISISTTPCTTSTSLSQPPTRKTVLQSGKHPATRVLTA